MVLKLQEFMDIIMVLRLSEQTRLSDILATLASPDNYCWDINVYSTPATEKRVIK